MFKNQIFNLVISKIVFAFACPDTQKQTGSVTAVGSLLQTDPAPSGAVCYLKLALNGWCWFWKTKKWKNYVDQFFFFFCALWIRQQSIPANYSEGHSIFPGICAGEEVDAIKLTLLILGISLIRITPSSEMAFRQIWPHSFSTCRDSRAVFSTPTG